MLLAMTPSNEDTTISRKPKDQFIDGVFNLFIHIIIIREFKKNVYKKVWFFFLVEFVGGA